MTRNGVWNAGMALVGIGLLMVAVGPLWTYFRTQPGVWYPATWTVSFWVGVLLLLASRRKRRTQAIDAAEGK